MLIAQYQKRGTGHRTHCGSISMQVPAPDRNHIEASWFHVSLGVQVDSFTIMGFSNWCVVAEQWRSSSSNASRDNHKEE